MRIFVLICLVFTFGCDAETKRKWFISGGPKYDKRGDFKKLTEYIENEKDVRIAWLLTSQESRNYLGILKTLNNEFLLRNFETTGGIEFQTEGVSVKVKAELVTSEWNPETQEGTLYWLHHVQSSYGDHHLDPETENRYCIYRITLFFKKGQIQIGRIEETAAAALAVNNSLDDMLYTTNIKYFNEVGPEKNKLEEFWRLIISEAQPLTGSQKNGEQLGAYLNERYSILKQRAAEWAKAKKAEADRLAAAKKVEAARMAAEREAATERAKAELAAQKKLKLDALKQSLSHLITGKYESAFSFAPGITNLRDLQQQWEMVSSRKTNADTKNLDFGAFDPTISLDGQWLVRHDRNVPGWVGVVPLAAGEVKPIRTPENLGRVRYAAYSPETNMVAIVGSRKNRFLLLSADISNPQFGSLRENAPYGQERPLFSFDGKRVLLNGKIFSVKGSDIKEFVVSKKGGFSPDGKFFGGSAGGITKVWDLKSGIYEIIDNVTVTGCSFSSDSKLLGGVVDNEIFSVWEVDTGKLILKVPSIHKAMFSPVGGFFVSVNKRGQVQIRDNQTGEVLSDLLGVSIEQNHTDLQIAVDTQREQVVVKDSSSIHTWDIFHVFKFYSMLNDTKWRIRNEINAN